MRTPKTYSPLIQRFRAAYFDRIPDSLRTLVRDEYCEVFSVSLWTFHHKLQGSNRAKMTEMEIQWMETADPFAIKAKRAEQAHA